MGFFSFLLKILGLMIVYSSHYWSHKGVTQVEEPASTKETSLRQARVQQNILHLVSSLSRVPKFPAVKRVARMHLLAEQRNSYHCASSRNLGAEKRKSIALEDKPISRITDATICKPNVKTRLQLKQSLPFLLRFPVPPPSLSFPFSYLQPNPIQNPL